MRRCQAEKIIFLFPDWLFYFASNLAIIDEKSIREGIIWDINTKRKERFHFFLF